MKVDKNEMYIALVVGVILSGWWYMISRSTVHTGLDMLLFTCSVLFIFVMPSICIILNTKQKECKL